MATAAEKGLKRVRVQLDLRGDQIGLLDRLAGWLGVRSRAELVQEAIGTLLWMVQERRRGRRIVSIEPSDLRRVQNAVEWASPALLMAPPETYEHLIYRPHPWRRQLSFKARNMTVGQFVATMNAEGLSPEEAAQDRDLPVEAVLEALAYYEVNRELVDGELREEGRRLTAAGYSIDPPHLP